MGGIAGGGLREEEAGVFEEPALGEVLGGGDGREQDERELHGSRRSAWTVKSSSFRGTLYSSFSMRRTVPKKRVERSCRAMRRSRPMAGVHIHWSEARSGWLTMRTATPLTSAGALKRMTALLVP